LESWGYQRIVTGAGQSALSGAQPVVVPFYNTRATADVLLAASGLDYTDEVAFIQDKILPLVDEKEANFNAPEINTFAAYFQQFGGWWANADALVAPAVNTLNEAMSVDAPEYEGEGEFILLPYVSPVLGEAGANKPWLQEVPDPTTTVMWNNWVEMNPETAHELGIEDDDVVKIISEAGEIDVSVYRYPAIHPGVIAIPFGQGHTAYGRYAENRGVNPLDLVSPKFNEAGDLAFAGMRVDVQKTGKKRVLSRLESKIGVYGEGLEE
jgi:formylmethanofuran dehydrogenase subunit D